MARARLTDDGSAGDAATPSSRSHRSVRWHLALVGAVFIGVRTVLWATGVRFQDRLVGQLQLLDEAVLEADPFVAFTQLHTQPPLWNFGVGAVRAWSPFGDAATFQVLFVAASAATMAMLWWVLADLGARRWQATVATILVATNPILIASESFLRYETVVTFIVTASVFSFARLVARPTAGRYAVFAAVLVVGVATRTLLHPLWLVGGLVVGAALAHRAGRLDRRHLLAGGAAVALVAAHLTFLAVRFGNTGYSSFVGMNLQRIALTTLPQDTLDDLRADGTVSPVAAVKPYEVLERYREADPDLAECEPDRRSPALSNPRKTTGEANLDHLCYREISDQLLEDSLAAIRAEPGNYLVSVGRASVLFVSRPVAFDQIDNDAQRLLDTVYAPLLLPVGVDHRVGGDDPQVATGFMRRGLGEYPVLLTMAAAVVVAVWRGAAASWRWARRQDRPGDPVVAWIGFTVVCVAVPSVILDFYENARFRQALDPILLGPLVVAVCEAARRAVIRFSPGGPGDGPRTR